MLTDPLTLKRDNGHLRATIEDVAKQAGVSTATVSRVINGTGQVSSKTADKVQSAIEALSYVPHGAARDLARNKTNIIGLVLPSTMMTPHYTSLLRGINEAILAVDYSLLIYCTKLNHNSPQPHTNLILGEHNTDGLIVFTNSVSDTMLKRLYNRNFPLTLLYRNCLLYTSPSPRDLSTSRMPSSA